VLRRVAIPDRGRSGRSPRTRASTTCRARPKAHRASLESAWGADTEEAPHPETEVERAGVHEQPLQHVLVAAEIRSAQSTGFIQMRTGTLQQFPASSQEAFAARAMGRPAVIALVGHDFLDHLHCVIGNCRHRFELFSRLRERLSNRRCIALVSALHGDATIAPVSRSIACSAL
jgi:hypothetical protein